MKRKWMLVLVTEAKIFIMGNGKKKDVKRLYRRWCRHKKDTYGKAVLSVYLTKIKGHQDNIKG